MPSEPELSLDGHDVIWEPSPARRASGAFSHVVPATDRDRSRVALGSVFCYVRTSTSYLRPSMRG
jgi:hypothetical protein